MPFKNIASRALLAVLASAAVVPLLGGAVMAESKKSIGRTENSLAAAGFIVKPANSPARLAMLARLPKDKFARRTKGDIVTYVFADPKACNCIYVGSQAAYGRYQKADQAKKLVDQERIAAEDYTDPAWNWDSWGSWGPSFGFRHHGW
jgi:hypothetical protein